MLAILGFLALPLFVFPALAFRFVATAGFCLLRAPAGRFFLLFLLAFLQRLAFGLEDLLQVARGLGHCLGLDIRLALGLLARLHGGRFLELALGLYLRQPARLLARQFRGLFLLQLIFFFAFFLGIDLGLGAISGFPLPPFGLGGLVGVF